jgi:hypothetical protein
MGTCFLGAVLAAALAPATSRRRVAIAALWLAATCPFLANYAAAVLTETLATFLSTAALTCFVLGLSRYSSSPDFFLWIPARRQTTFCQALLGAFLTGIASLVRPEMPLLLVVAAVVYGIRWGKALGFRKLILGGAAMAGAFLLPLVPWAARNLITLHEVQILSPRYVVMPEEFAPVGYYKWTGTWLERYRDVYLSVWKIGEERVDVDDLPQQAFDSPQEKAQVADLFERYNDSDNMDISPEMDREFAAIARARTRRHPFRTYVRVPFQRALSMWFTPRTELLPIDGKLWPLRDQWNDSPADVLTTAVFAALDYVYVAMALGGVWIAWRAARESTNASALGDLPNLWGIALVLAYLLMRTAFLTTVEAPEPRYVITCYPAVLALAALLWDGRPQ